MWFALAVGLAINVVAYLILPKAKAAKPAAATDMEDPTAEAGRPMPVPFGTITIKGSNLLWYGEKSLRSYEKSAGKGKK
jgi:hypothetical protein